jgi:hypothetical protein
MGTWAVLAAKPAANATGFGAGLVPAIGTGSLDGFVIGAALTGACFITLTAPGRARRRTAQAAAPCATSTASMAGALSAAGPFSAGPAVAATETADTAVASPDTAVASPDTIGAGAAASAAAGKDSSDRADSARSALLRRYFLAAEQFEPNWDQQTPAAEQAPAQVQSDSGQDGFAGDWAEDDAGVSGYQSRHRLGDGSPIRRPRQKTRRTAPKHAAPPSSFASRLTGMFAGLAVLSAARH